MDFTRKNIADSRERVRAQEARVARQRRMLEAALDARHPADDLRARLLIMEQSLLAMARFLEIRERDLRLALGAESPKRPQRIKVSRKAATPADSGGDPTEGSA